MLSRTIVDLPVETLARIVRMLSPLDRFRFLLTSQRLRIMFHCNGSVYAPRCLPDSPQQAYLTNIPVELLLKVFRMLGLRDRFRLALSCKQMEEVACTNLIGVLYTKEKFRHLLALPAGTRIKDDFALQKLLNRLFWTRYASHELSREFARLI